MPLSGSSSLPSTSAGGTSLSRSCVYPVPLPARSQATLAGVSPGPPSSSWRPPGRIDGGDSGAPSHIPDRDGAVSPPDPASPSPSQANGRGAFGSGGSSG